MWQCKYSANSQPIVLLQHSAAAPLSFCTQRSDAALTRHTLAALSTLQRPSLAVACLQQTPSIHMLFRLEMAIDAHHLRIVNFSVNPDDASAGLTLSLARFRLNLQQAMNRPNPGKVQPGMSHIAAKRWAPQLRLWYSWQWRSFVKKSKVVQQMRVLALLGLKLSIWSAEHVATIQPLACWELQVMGRHSCIHSLHSCGHPCWLCTSCQASTAG